MADALVGTGFPYDFTDRLDRVLDRLQLARPAAQGLRRMGAASVDLAYVACGKLDIFYEEGLKPGILPPASCWWKRRADGSAT